MENTCAESFKGGEKWTSMSPSLLAVNPNSWMSLESQNLAGSAACQPGWCWLGSMLPLACQWWYLIFPDSWIHLAGLQKHERQQAQVLFLTLTRPHLQYCICFVPPSTREVLINCCEFRGEPPRQVGGEHCLVKRLRKPGVFISWKRGGSRMT